MGWIGVAMTGSDTASNVLFGGNHEGGGRAAGPVGQPDERGQQFEAA